MAKIDELLKELCPDGVDNVSLDSILEYEQPSKYIVKSTEYNDLYSIPVLTAGKSFLLGYTDETSGVYEASSAKPTIIFDDFTTSFHWVDFPCKVKSSALKFIRPKNKDNVSFRYVYYQMSIIKFVAQEHIRHWISVYSKFEIPLPPLPIQQHIVEVLDTFTDAISNLEEELALREKQFGFYREQLLSFDDEASLGGKLFSDKVEYVKLKDICLNICSGGTPLTSNKEYYSGSNPWLRTQEVDWNDVYDTELKISEDAIKNSSAKLIPANCLIVAMYGATAGKCCINRIPLTTNQACCNLQIDERQALVKYVFHWVCKEYHHIKAMGEGSQSNLNAQKVKSYPVPLPSISIQKEIVEILDTFEAMIANIKEEISLRTKQYEYYREKLLSFGN